MVSVLEFPLMPTCLQCGGTLGEWDIHCDGCHRFVHKGCTNGYKMVQTYYGGELAFLFCKECEAVKDDNA